MAKKETSESVFDLGGLITAQTQPSAAGRICGVVSDLEGIAGVRTSLDVEIAIVSGRQADDNILQISEAEAVVRLGGVLFHAVSLDLFHNRTR